MNKQTRSQVYLVGALAIGFCLGGLAENVMENAWREKVPVGQAAVWEAQACGNIENIRVDSEWLYADCVREAGKRMNIRLPNR